MAVKSASIPAPKVAAAPAKTGNGKTVQRKAVPGLFASSMIQRKEQPGSWVHRNTQKPVNSRTIIQPKATVHASNDHYEKEADHIADKVVSSEKIAAPVRVSKVNRAARAAQRKCSDCGGDKEVQAMHVQRKCSSCEETVQKKESTKKYSSSALESSDSGPPAAAHDKSNNSLDKVLENQSSRGSPLPAAVRNNMESRMGADFSNVRVHTGSSSHEASTSIGARAFTNGNNIHFAKGEFNPASKSGKHLLAHELAHTIQQGAAPEKTTIPPTPEKGRKIVAKPKFEKKVARIPSPYNNKKDSRKEENDGFAKKVKKRKSARIPAAAFKKEKGKNLDKDPIALPKKDKKKQPAAPKVPVKPKHLVNVKSQQSQIAQLASKGISFKPFEDKKIGENPLFKAQSQQSKNISEGVLFKASQSAAKISDTIVRVRPRLSMVSAKAIAGVKNNEAVQKEKISTETKAQQSAVKKAMQSASGSINGYHTKVTGEITAAAKTARTDIETAKTNNTTSINDAAIAQAPVIGDAYIKAQKDFEESGRSVGSTCTQRTSTWSQNYLSSLKHEDDSLLDGPYTDDVKRARADATTKVGTGYNEGIAKAGVDQGASIHEGKSADLKKISDAQEEMLKHVNETYDTALKGIDAAETSGIKQAGDTKKSMIASVGTQHKAAQAKLSLTQKTQGQLCEILSKKQSEQIELQAEQATQSMEEGGAESLKHLHNGFKEYKQVCESMNSPPPAMLQKQLQPMEAALAQNAPAMAASMQKGMLQTENGFMKTADDTIATTNSTVSETMAQGKADNDKAISGLKQLQTAAVTSLQGTLNTNKKTITGTATQCTADIQAIKAAFDTTLTNISTDLTSGMKKGSDDLKKGLTDTVDHGQGETKSLAKTSTEEEDKAAAEVSPRWKSVLKVLLVIVVTLLIALVVGPAVIGFIGAAAGGGAFGAAVGAVVGGAILGAASSAVITIGNNLIDGKTWYKGVGAAMLEGAITGAIGGAFGAAGSGIAGKLVSTAAKGVGPALARFGISQAVDFAGNVTTEYVSSKLQGKEFNWTAVAQGQAIGAGMHIGMGGLGALKDVKGFKTINKISEGAGALGESFGNKLRGKAQVAAPHIAPTKVEIEEPKNKGPSAPKEEPGIIAPKEEPKAPAAKEEGPGATVKEEPKAPAPKEEPMPAAPKEEPKAPAPKEEPHNAPVKEEPKGTGPKEEPGAGKTAPEENSPATKELENKFQNDEDVKAKVATEDGHDIKVDSEGNMAKCSECKLYELANKDTLDKHPDLKEDLATLREKMKENPDGHAKELAEFDKKLTQREEMDNFAKAKEDAYDQKKIDQAYEDYKAKKIAQKKPIRSKENWQKGKQYPSGKSKGGYENTIQGRVGEHQADYHLNNEGYTKKNHDGNLIKVDEAPKGKGIDGVWTKDGEVYVTETKSGGADLSPGQMSDKWITDRLPTLDPDTRTLVETALKNGTLKKLVIKVDANGIVTRIPIK